MKTQLLVSLVASALALCVGAEGAAIAFEHFDYPIATIGGDNGGFGFAAAYSGNGQVDRGSLAFTDPAGAFYPGSGNHFSNNTSGGGAFRLLSTANRPAGLLDVNKFGANGSTIYLGFLVALDSGVVNSYGDYAGVSFFNGSREELFFGDLGFEGANRFWGVDPQNSAGGVYESNVPVNTTVRLLIGRIDFAVGQETVRFYVDPVMSQEPATPTIGPFPMRDFRFDRIRIEAGGNGRYSFDEIKIGTTYKDAVPEPAITPLLASGMLILASRRKR